jgi:hypothetical protein
LRSSSSIAAPFSLKILARICPKCCRARSARHAAVLRDKKQRERTADSSELRHSASLRMTAEASGQAQHRTLRPLGRSQGKHRATQARGFGRRMSAGAVGADSGSKSPRFTNQSMGHPAFWRLEAGCWRLERANGAIRMVGDGGSGAPAGACHLQL